jgi:GMP synthase-like glutamine amidotransferase
MGYYGPMGYGMQFPANQLGGPLKLWGKRGYGLTEVWVKRGLTVIVNQKGNDCSDNLKAIDSEQSCK